MPVSLEHKRAVARAASKRWSEEQKIKGWFGLIPEEVFEKRRRRQRASYAKYCQSEKGKAHLKAYSRSPAFRLSQKSSPGSILAHIRASARQRGLECTLTREDVQQLISPMKCEVTGMALSWGVGKTKCLLSPSLDRIDNSVGYVPGNMQCVALWVNLARNSAPLEELKAILDEFRASAVKRPVPETDEWRDPAVEAPA